MKKLLAVLGVSLLLTGCGSDDPVAKTCKKDLSGVMDMEIVLNGTDDALDNITVNLGFRYESINLSKDATDKEKETVKQDIENSLIEEYNINGNSSAKITSAFNNNGLSITITAKAGTLDQVIQATDMKSAIKEAESKGFICE